MSPQWYVQVGGQAKGPFTSKRLKSLADEAKISRETKVRKGDDGEWTPARRVKGLFEDAPEPSSESSESPMEDPIAAVKDPHEAESDLEAVYFLPNYSVKRRLIVLGCLIAFALIGTAAWYQKLFFAASMALLLGTYSRTRLSRKRLERKFVVMFFPARVTGWPLHRFIAIETDTEFTLPAWTILLLGPCLWIWIRLFDFFLPWFSGGYKIWLRDWREERVLAWQGNGEESFRSNVQLLEDMTGLPVKRG